MGDEVELVAVGLLVIYTSLLFVGLGSTLIRAWRYRRDDVPAPRLLRRDLAVVSGHALPLVVLLVLRILDVVHFDFSRGGVNSSPLAWVLVLSPAVFAIAVYVYYEFFVIGG